MNGSIFPNVWKVRMREVGIKSVGCFWSTLALGSLDCDVVEQFQFPISGT